MSDIEIIRAAYGFACILIDPENVGILVTVYDTPPGTSYQMVVRHSENRIPARFQFDALALKCGLDAVSPAVEEEIERVRLTKVSPTHCETCRTPKAVALPKRPRKRRKAG